MTSALATSYTGAEPTQSAATFVDEAFHFGDGERLAGILTRPTATPQAGQPAVLMWNVGLNHHVGPYRIYVDLARQLGKAGFLALRFDLSGLGDSEQAQSSAASDSERNVSDVRAAMDVLAREHKVETFVLIGFCSSVDSAHAAALTDKRIIGLINIEGYASPTTASRFLYPLRLLDRHRWQRWSFNRSRPVVPVEANAEAPDAAVFQRDQPTDAQLASEFKTLVARGVRFLKIFVRGDSIYEYKEQVFACFKDSDLETASEVEFFPRGDHIFSRIGDRKALVQRIVTFLVTRFGAKSGT
jgi:dienelactone hydrolase